MATSKKSNTAVENTQASAETVDQANTTQSNGTIEINVEGKFKSSFTATAGETLRRAFINSGKHADRDYEGFSFTDENGKAVSLDRKLSAPLKLTAITKVNGG